MKTIKNIVEFLFWAYVITSSIMATISDLKPKKYHTVVIKRTM